MSFSDTSVSSLTEGLERAILVGIEYKNALDDTSVESSLAELARLADTAGATVVATTTQRLDAPNPRTFVGSGKAEEIADMCRSLAADVVIFDEELTPSQQSNLEKVVPKDVKVIDRTALILDIFALHATTKEGRLQVRLAQNQYLYPRLRGMWAHLASNRMGGGVGSRFGEGESQLEVDRRMVRKRITSIRRELAQVSKMRSTQRAARYASGIYKVAEAGYTNAGKSSLINRLAGAEVLSYDKLFATLDSTTRKLVLPEGREVTLTDTVGFIQKLPTTLVEAFNSTLDEIRGADLILHVVDASSPERERQMAAVDETLEQIGAHEIPRILVFNKCDLVDGSERIALAARYPDAVFVSAQTGEGSEDLIHAIERAATASESMMEVVVPYSRGDVTSLAHAKCTVIAEAYEERGTVMTLRVPQNLVKTFSEFRTDGTSVSA
ncbi:GTPase HflX [Slackia equolifaciens]|uniref:GTPase HflX n=1 Tax=Slackia equolifaciens TaxID=498718 RepID=A0A3N0B1Z9_9ACTN|nr:GTPase HflX [Slackia equolifaciens]RNL40988.1 GTPase HflX [Slackia equolifaciens]